MNVGVGVADITPPLPVVLAGFGEAPLATDVHSPLEVRAIRFEAGGVATCLLVCDLLGMSPHFSGPVRAAVAQALGLDVAAVLTACNHTHAGPSAMAGTEAVWPTPEGYRELLVDRCVEAARRAAAHATDATLRFGRWPLPDGLSINRRGHHHEPGFAVLDVLAAGGDGERIATLANLAIHPVALGPECTAVSSDWIGAFRSTLEARSGGTAIVLSGALGDVNPRHVHRQRNDCANDGFDEAEELGCEVAEAVDDVLSTTEALEGGGVAVERTRVLTLDADPSTILGRPRHGKPVDVELVEWSIGPIRLVTIPGEAFERLGRRIEDRHDGRVLLAGLSPSWHGYLPDPFTAGYEEEMSLGSNALRAIAEALVDR